MVWRSSFRRISADPTTARRRRSRSRWNWSGPCSGQWGVVPVRGREKVRRTRRYDDTSTWAASSRVRRRWNAPGARTVPGTLGRAPYDIASNRAEQRLAADDFWDHLRWRVTTGPALLLEEMLVGNVSRWHRLTADGCRLRSDLVPGAIPTVWPDLSSDVEAVLASLPDEGLMDSSGSRIMAGSAASSRTRPSSRSWPSRSVRHGLPRYCRCMSTRHPSTPYCRTRWRAAGAVADRADRERSTLGGAERTAPWSAPYRHRPRWQLPALMPSTSAAASRPAMCLDGRAKHRAVGQEITATVLDVDLVRERVTLALASVE